MLLNLVENDSKFELPLLSESSLTEVDKANGSGGGSGGVGGEGVGGTVGGVGGCGLFKGRNVARSGCQTKFELLLGFGFEEDESDNRFTSSKGPPKRPSPLPMVSDSNLI